MFSVCNATNFDLYVLMCVVMHSLVESIEV